MSLKTLRSVPHEYQHESPNISYMEPNQTEIQKCIYEALDEYLETLGDQEPSGLHKLVMEEVEGALIRYVMQHCRDNQCRVSKYLGINRGTLRKRLKDYDI